MNSTVIIPINFIPYPIRAEDLEKAMFGKGLSFIPYVPFSIQVSALENAMKINAFSNTCKLRNVNVYIDAPSLTKNKLTCECMTDIGSVCIDGYLSSEDMYKELGDSIYEMTELEEEAYFLEHL